ncbi:hypothetical protein Tco_0666812 [Tanacetum coccineum]
MANLPPDHNEFTLAAEVAPNNNNGWIEWDVPLGGEMDEPMVDLKFDEMDDDVWDQDDEWLMAPMMPPRDTVTVSSTYEVRGPSTATLVGHPLTVMALGVATQPHVIDDLCIQMDNLEYRHGVLMRKIETVSDAEVANSIAIGEIHPRVTTIEGQINSNQREDEFHDDNPPPPPPVTPIQQAPHILSTIKLPILKKYPEDLEQVDEFDLEEMDLKWQVAMIFMRLNKFYKSTGRKLQFDAKELVGFDKTKQKDNGGDRKTRVNLKALVTIDGDGVDWTSHAEDEQENFVLIAYNNSGSNTEGDQIYKGVLSYENEVLESVFDSRSSDLEDSPMYDRFVKVEGMLAVPPPMTGIYMPPKYDFGIDDVETLESVPKPAVNEPKAISKLKFGLMLLSLRRKGPNWLFDLDYLTDSMNYQPVTAENKANKIAGPKEANHSTAKNGDEKPNGDFGLKINEEPKDQEDQAFLEELERLKRQEKEANDAAEPFRKDTASPSRIFSTGGPNLINNDQDDSQIPALKDIYENPSDGIFTNVSYDDEGAVADFTNLETTVNVSPIPTSRIYSIHPITHSWEIQPQ